MRITKSIPIALTLCSALTGILPGPATAQNYPSRSIRYIVPFPPGGGTDIVARALAPRLLESAGITLIIDNRGGGGTVVGAEIAARSPADGYTVFMGTNTSHAINPNLPAKLPYDAVRDFQPVTRLALVPYMVTVHPSLPARNIKELVALAKMRPNDILYSSAGIGNSDHMAGELLGYMTGTKFTHVPNKGGPQALQQVISGEVVFYMAGLPVCLPFVKSGRVRGLAVTTAKRSPAAPDIPTMQEAGVAGYQHSLWNAVFAPAGTPPAIVAKISEDFGRVTRLPDVQERFASFGIEAVANSPAQFDQFFRAEVEKWARVVKATGIHGE